MEGPCACFQSGSPRDGIAPTLTAGLSGATPNRLVNEAVPGEAAKPQPGDLTGAGGGNLNRCDPYRR